MRALKLVFWNAWERRLRAGWRILLQLALFVAILIAAGLTGYVLGKGNAAAIVSHTVYLLFGLGVAWLFARFIDRRPFVDYGFHLNGAWWFDFGFGFALGAGLMTGIFLMEARAGWIDFEPGPRAESGPAPFVALYVCVIVGLNEELTFRGYQLKNLAEGLAGKWIGPRLAIVLAWALTSALFGAGHALNPHATVVSTLNIVVAGLLLSVPFVLTGELAMSIGLHASWNLFQGTVYGFPVSGSAPTRHLINFRQAGPDFWTGGEFGPEGGMLGLLWTLGGCVAIVLWLAVRRRRLRLEEGLARYDSPASVEVAGTPELTEATP